MAYRATNKHNQKENFHINMKIVNVQSKERIRKKRMMMGGSYFSGDRKTGSSYASHKRHQVLGQTTILRRLSLVSKEEGKFFIFKTDFRNLGPLNQLYRDEERRLNTPKKV